jgi:NAD(P)H-flavin reductase
MRTLFPLTPARLAIAALAIRAVCLAQAGGGFPHAAEVIARESLTHDVVRVTLRLEDPGRFRLAPAQYVRIRVPEPFVEAWNRRYGTTHGEVSRPYSVA